MLRQTRRALLCLLLLSTMMLVHAQDGGRLIINFPTVQDDGGETDPQVLDVIFTVINGDGTVATEQPDGGTLQLDTGEVVNVNIEPAQNPLFIVMVLDASGSMGPAAAAMRDAAINAVNNAPPEALIAVYQFNRQINLLQGFTPDRNLVINAIASIEPPPTSDPNAGTCLYDAILEGATQLENASVGSRRAMILFTDGRDELTRDGEPCSESELGEGIEQAIRVNAPIYAIGLTGDRNVNVTELQSISSQTGGVAVTGTIEQLQDFFGAVMRALRSQWRARANICVPAGARTGTLTIQPAGSSLSGLPPVAFSFEVERGCTVPPTAEPTITPVPLRLSVEAFRFNQLDESASFEVRQFGTTSAVGNFRIQINDGNTGVQLQDFTVDFTGENPQRIEFDVSEIGSTNITIIASAQTANGELLAQSEEANFGLVRPSTPTPTFTPTPPPVEILVDGLDYLVEEDNIKLDLVIDHLERVVSMTVDVIEEDTNVRVLNFNVEVSESFTLDVNTLLPDTRYLVRVNAVLETGERVTQEALYTHRPLLTPTPTPTSTPAPPALTFQSVIYDIDTDTYAVTLDIQNQDRVLDFRVDVLDERSNTIIGQYGLTLGQQLAVSTENMVPGVSYIIRLQVQSPEGRQQVDYEVIYDPPRTPTPTSSPTPTPTMTPFISIAAVRPDTDRVTYSLDMDTNDPGDVVTYRIRIINAGGVQVGDTIVVNTPPFDTVSFSMSDLNAPPGEYQVEIRGFNDLDQPVTATTLREFTHNPPPPPTNTPAPGFFERLAGSAQDNPIIAVLIVVAFLLLLGLLLWLIRQGRKETRRPTVVNPGKTEVFSSADVAKALGGSSSAASKPEQKASAPLSAPSAPSGADKTIVDMSPPPPTDDKTFIDARENVLPPNVKATLYVLKADDATMVNRSLPITSMEFTIGRRGTDVEFNDPRISRTHVTLIYDARKGQFFLRDENSSGGTFIGNQKLEPNTLVGLTNDAIIKLSTTTELKFVSEEQTYVGGFKV